MRWRICAIGKPRLAFARTGIEEYTKRLRAFAPIELAWLKASPSADTESAALLERSAGCFRVGLDERGEQLTSRTLAERIGKWEQGRHKEIAVLIGGAEGHTEALRGQCNWTWSLSKLTLQHELALVVVLEQIYRAYSIKANLPYHRD
ncbi:MAG TPA: 23S rRNA (pseudouridine(1915)-N(3))-methyltransferase RlmH [Chthoniobacteraceae bacterium]|jgi:23S rRNA (pseudouridine1915-N3)-methyltransferase